jgi:hypothetical protein
MAPSSQDVSRAGTTGRSEAVRRWLDSLIDEASRQSFPASDPPALQLDEDSWTWMYRRSRAESTPCEVIPRLLWNQGRLEDGQVPHPFPRVPGPFAR